MSTQQDKFIEIADAIRSKLGTTNKIKPNDFAKKISEIQVGGDTSAAYDEGYKDGFDVGKGLSGTSYWDTFWDNYQGTGDNIRNNWNHAFYNRWWNDDNYKPKYGFTVINYANNMFSGSVITDTKKPLDFTKLSRQATGVFQNCNSMKTINTLTVNENTSFTDWFKGCSALQHITFDGTIGQSLIFADSKLLSQASIDNIVEHLRNYKEEGVTLPSPAPSVTFSPNLMTSLTAYQKTLATQKGWVLVK